MADPDTEKSSPYGFIIYRGTHTDDAMWDRYMAYLKHVTHQNLESEGMLGLWEDMDWKVITSPELDGDDGGPWTVRRLFRKWLKSGEEKFEHDNYRYRACLYVDDMCLEAHDYFMKDKSLDGEDQLQLRDYRGLTMAYLVSRFKREGWVLVTPGLLMPRAGEFILDDENEVLGWASVYTEEGTVSCNF